MPDPCLHPDVVLGTAFGVQAFYFTAACSGVVTSSVVTLYASAVIAGTCLNATYAVFFEVGIEGKRNTALAMHDSSIHASSMLRAYPSPH